MILNRPTADRLTKFDDEAQEEETIDLTKEKNQDVDDDTKNNSIDNKKTKNRKRNY